MIQKFNFFAFFFPFSIQKVISSAQNLKIFVKIIQNYSHFYLFRPKKHEKLSFPQKKSIPKAPISHQFPPNYSKNCSFSLLIPSKKTVKSLFPIAFLFEFRCFPDFFSKICPKNHENHEYLNFYIIFAVKSQFFRFFCCIFHISLHNFMHFSPFFFFSICNFPPKFVLFSLTKSR